MAAEEAKLNELIVNVVDDIGASLSAVLVGIGDRLGLYAALAEGPAAPASHGASTITSCSRGRSASSPPAIEPTWWTPGSPRSTE
jgi:hypothetical protein